MRDHRVKANQMKDEKWFLSLDAWISPTKLGLVPELGGGGAEEGSPRWGHPTEGKGPTCQHLPEISRLMLGSSAGQELLTVMAGVATPWLLYTSSRFPDTGSWGKGGQRNS